MVDWRQQQEPELHYILPCKFWLSIWFTSCWCLSKFLACEPNPCDPSYSMEKCMFHPQGKHRLLDFLSVVLLKIQCIALWSLPEHWVADLQFDKLETSSVIIVQYLKQVAAGIPSNNKTCL
ncbi:unnamed protein product [Lathyrus oleraceus]